MLSLWGGLRQFGRVKIKSWRKELQLAHRWRIARGTGTNTYQVLFVEIETRDGLVGVGESAPSSRYGETVDSGAAFLDHVDPSALDLNDIPGSMARLNAIAPGNYSAKGALNMALLDALGKREGKPIYDLLGLGFKENKHVTSFSIGIDTPEVIRQKVAAAADYPVLKLKVGSPDDRDNMAALRAAAPTKTVRVDANEGWRTKEEALRQIEWLAADGHIEFVEQPMPATSDPADFKWLKERSPLPIMADESYISAANIQHCADCFHSVNVKLVKAGGITAGFEALSAARKAGLKTMLGCMIESSVLISAAAHLAELTDYLDIDGNLLITNDPYRGASAVKGMISFANAPAASGLRVAPAS